MLSKKFQFFILLVMSCIFFAVLAIRTTPKKLSSDNPIFETITENPRPTPTPVKEKPVKVVLAGDVMLGRTVMINAFDKKDMKYPFRNVADLLTPADIVFVNLENPIIKDCPVFESGFKFCADPRLIEGLLYAGVDVVSLANNHTKNFGEDGLNQTVSFLDRNHIKATGLGNLVLLDKKGTTFGFLGFDFTVRTPSDTDYALIKDSDAKADVLIVGIHWGVEYTDKPTSQQRLWAKKIVESGADVIAGHHPHWVQITEKMDGVPVYYSLGNFVFDQMWSEETKKGLVVRLSYDSGKIIKEENFPTYIRVRGQPEFINPIPEGQEQLITR